MRLFELLAEYPWVPVNASDIGREVDRLFWFLTLVSAGITGLLCFLVAYYSIRYRRRTEDEVPAEPETHRLLEVGWSLALLAIFMVIFGWGTVVYVRMKKPAEHALEISVIGKQWMWKTQHPGGQREINGLHVPVGVPVKLVMTSQDVIHSFGVPAFRIKQDVLPGSYSTQWFTATRVGTYHLFCQEYCGTNHSSMRGFVYVMEPKDYAAWLAGVSVDEAPAAVGARLFRSYGCAQCHGQVAPTLAGLYGREQRLRDGTTVIADEAYIRESILNPSAKVVAGYAPSMPSYRGQLTEEQVSALTAYIRSLGSAKAEGSTTLPNASAPVTRPVEQVAPLDAARLPPSREPPGPVRTPIKESPE
jgi:cytochrome c oxidase subunit 2